MPLRLHARIRFCAPPERVYEHFARGVFEHAIAPPADPAHDGSQTVLTRYETKRPYNTVVTTEEATLVPGRSVTWRHVDGPLTGTVETFRVEPKAGCCVVAYEAEVRARSPFFRGPLLRLFVGPELRRVSVGAILRARRELDA